MKPTYFEISEPNTIRLPVTGIENWDNEGVLHLENFIPTDLIDAYVEERTKLLGGTEKWRPGWNGPCPYLEVSSMRNLACYRPLTEKMKFLLHGEEPGLHLCLTGFQSTERKTHADAYLNPSGVNDHYLAIWIALDDIHPDSGPFSYAPGSHRWPAIQRDRVWSKMKQLGQDSSLPTWPSDSQDWVGAACDEEIQKRGIKMVPFLGKKGSVLIWNAYLLHQGSVPNNHELERRALIAHFSSIRRRSDMNHLKRMDNGSYYFEFPGYQEPCSSTHSGTMIDIRILS